MIGACQSSPSIMFTILGSGSTVFTEQSSMLCKSTSDYNVAFLATALANSSTSVLFALSIYSTVNLLK
jgi:hypothetical protein